MLAFESCFSSTVLFEMALSATEDAVDAVSLGIPGIAPTLRSRYSLPKRLSGLLSRVADLRETLPPAGRSSIDRLIDSLEKRKSLTDVDICIKWWREHAVALDEFEGVGSVVHATHQNAGPVLQSWFTLSVDSARKRLVLKTSTQAETGVASLDSFGREADFVQAVTAMCAAYRRERQRRFSAEDRLALLRAYHLVEIGVMPAPKIHPIRTDQLRPYSTYLALADPGRAHLQTTVWDDSLLAGLVVHVETIDRAGITDRRRVEAYRIPSIRDVARIRVHVGEATPCSVYVGRPVFEGWSQTPTDDTERQQVFDQSLLKAAHTVAAACSGFFSLGVAECKIGLDGLTAWQAIETMKAIGGNVIRDRYRQRLSAAFNINTPIRDDRDALRPRDVTERLKVANLGIELARRGGFDKVTWDGAIDGPSQPFLEQVSVSELLELVHRAHERGLETYISAGMTEAHMIPAAQVGVGGVGMGILMHAKTDNGAITDLLPDRVRTVLAVRDNASNQLAGRAATALAKLDWLSFAGPLSDSVENVRQRLYATLLEHHGLTEDHARMLHEPELKQCVESAEARVNEFSKSIDLDIYRAGDATTASKSDPVFAAAEGKLRKEWADHPDEDSDMAKELRFLITAEDAEALRAVLGND